MTARRRPLESDDETLDLSALARVKLIVLSDTHGLVDPRVLAAVKGADLVVHGGDVGGARVLEELAASGARVLAVHGNNDVSAKWPAGEERVLSSLPRVWRVELPGGTLVVEHGHQAGGLKGRHARLRKRYAGARAVVVGHSHLLNIDDESLPWVLNPGAAGYERTHGGPSFIALSATKRRWRAVPRRFQRSPRPQAS